MEYTLLSQTTNLENQDRAVVLPNDDQISFILSDGAGGSSGGSEAAQTVVEHLNHFEADDIILAIKQLDTFLLKNNECGEATLVYIKLLNNHLSGISVGDSEAWLIKENDVIFLTENQYHKPLLGSGVSHLVEFKNILFSGTLLIASDGLTKYTSVKNIVTTVRQYTDLEDCTKQLLKLVQYPSGTLPDDTTIILCKA